MPALVVPSRTATHGWESGGQAAGDIGKANSSRGQEIVMGPCSDHARRVTSPTSSSHVVAQRGVIGAAAEERGFPLWRGRQSRGRL